MILEIEEKTPLKLLIMEDSPGQRDKYKKDFDKLNWKVTIAYNSDDAAKKHAEAAYDAKRKFDVLVFDCMIGPTSDSGFRLAIKIADKEPNQRILLYTTQSPGGQMDYNHFVKDLTSRRISFMKIAGNDNEEALPLELAIWATWKGYFIFSPTPADYLSTAIANQPDPLEKLDWEILKALHKYPDDRTRASRLVSMTDQNLNRRLRDKIKPILTPLLFPHGNVEKENSASREFLDADFESTGTNGSTDDGHEKEKITDDVVRVFVSWYLENRFKYCRE